MFLEFKYKKHDQIFIGHLLKKSVISQLCRKLNNAYIK